MSGTPDHSLAEDEPSHGRSHLPEPQNLRPLLGVTGEHTQSVESRGDGDNAVEGDGSASWLVVSTTVLYPYVQVDGTLQMAGRDRQRSP